MSKGTSTSLSSQTQQKTPTTPKPQTPSKDTPKTPISKAIAGKKPHGSRVIKSGG